MRKIVYRATVPLMLILTLCVLAGGAAWAKNPHNTVYVVGDSLSDPGNFYDLTGFWPPSPPYATTFSNGPVWTDYLAADLGIKVDSRAYGGAMTGDYLVGGMTVSNFNNVQYPGLFPQPLPGVPDEIEDLLDDYPNGLNPFGLYVVWAGPNDFFFGLATGSVEPVLGQAVQNIAETVCTLGSFGARHFVVANIPDIGKTPFASAMGPEAPMLFSQAIAAANTGLEQALATLPPHCAESIDIFDSYQALNDIINAPQDYGLSNVSDACLVPPAGLCAEPDRYLFWDDVHPTTATHAIFAEQMRASFCNTDGDGPGLRGRPSDMPPPAWRGVCYGAK